ncbi:McrC family protein [Methanococcus voltae]|uniref:5-methylcytosine restriction system component-like protein n=1 Tax=Methanococcus voltae (strain ATCC BAA-1334 / A3) TaxID=456320 RepID=D7DSU5_METV3|nr:McrC family protein [Methanococcus voltae]MCS3901806.1 5-methylcytosine-specific restriction enzyme subunit McrC [Methanococcus voltae]
MLKNHKSKNFVITEYGFIAKRMENKQEDDHIILKKDLFDSLKLCILKEGYDDFLTISYQKNHGEILKAKNYVGLIQMKNGLTIEILPKIHNNSFKDLKPNERIIKTRKIFLKMLKTLKDSPFKKLNHSNLKSENLPINEIFIKMFLDELDVLYKKGLKSDYKTVEKNLNVLKGRLKFKENIKHNYIHKERFFVEYDEFIKDMPENRLIKSTLNLLNHISKNPQNLKRINEYIHIFKINEVYRSKNVEKDFKYCKNKNNRLMTHYSNIMNYCNVFLKNQSFSSFKGSKVAFALLYPMEKVFESYVTHSVKKMDKFDYVNAQHSKYHLARFEDENSCKNLFKLRPDVYAESEDIIYLLDAKWKLLDVNAPNFGVSQSDAYQLLSYAKIYENKCGKPVKLGLIYPKTDKFVDKKYLTCNDCNNVELIIYPFDLGN